MNLSTVSKPLAYVTTFVCFTICVFLLGQIIGFEQGATFGNHSASRVLANKIILSFSIGPSAYDFFVWTYIVIAVCFCLFAFTKTIENGKASIVISAIPLIVILISYLLLIRWKNQYLELNADFGYYYWIINSIPFDWICASLVLLLLAAQIAGVIYKVETISTQPKKVLN